MFKLAGYPREDQDREYLVTSTTHHIEADDYESSAGGDGPVYHNSFTVIHSQTPYRPACTTPKPEIKGPQTAIVVGPAGEEIYTDKYGRVKLQFHWDRYGKSDENASCWVRVSQFWAGKTWGGIHIPRIGQEVIVEFLEGDPDKPIVTGRVYNADHMPPNALPANKTQSGIKSRSSKDGTGANCNEFRMEDLKGREHLLLHAEKDQDIEVENDEGHWVGHDRSKTIDHDETSHIKHDRSETVDNNETITIHKNRSERVDKNEKISIGVNRTEDVGSNETISIGANRTEDVGNDESVSIGDNQSVSIGKNHSLKVGKHQQEKVGKTKTETIGIAKALSIGAGYQISVGAAMNITVGLSNSEQVGLMKNIKVGKTLSIDAGDKIEIVTGDSSITMTDDGKIIIKGKDVLIIGD